MAERHGFWLATMAVLAAAGFTLVALIAPAYSSGETLLEANRELPARIAVAFPLAITSAVWVLLHAACRHGRRWARAAAVVIAWTLAAFAVVTGFSIGLFVMPIAAVLVVAAHLTPVAADGGARAPLCHER